MRDDDMKHKHNIIKTILWGFIRIWHCFIMCMGILKISFFSV